MSRIHINFRFLSFVCGFSATLFMAAILTTKLYADSGTWVSGDLPTLSVHGQVSSPTITNNCVPTVLTYFSYTKADGSFDSLGRNLQQSTCMVQNLLGTYGGSNSIADDFDLVKPNTALAFHVAKPNGSSMAATPVPNQSVFFTKDSSGSAHGEVAPHFYDSFTSAGTFGQFTVDSTKELALQINQTGTVLKDSANKTIYMHAYAFSPNGQWMVIEAANLGLVRINTLTREMQLFSAEILPYNLGFTPKAVLAISDDGSSVIKSGKNAGDTTVYDLNGCLPGNFAINGDNTAAMQGCENRNVYASLRTQLSGFDYLTGMKFSADSKSITGFAERTGGLGASDYFAITYAVAGYQIPETAYVALGDSFSSGEGAYDYQLGTNVDTNTCHLSQNSYPYLAANALGIPNFHSVACSGARTSDYYGSQIPKANQPIMHGDWDPGYLGQGQYFSQAGKTSVVTISMIGNDIGFADKLKACIFEPVSCFHFREDRQNIADEIYRTFDEKLVPLYQSIKADSGNPDNVKVYVLGYPQILGSGPSCSANVPFSQEERQMATGLITYLDAVIKAATQKAGVQYIDVEHALDGHRLCEGDEVAVNGLNVDGSMPLSHFTAIANSSFHPNVLGQQLLAQALIGQSQDFTKAMPAANASAVAPYAGSDSYNALLGNAPSGGTLNRLVYIGEQTSDLALKTSSLPILSTSTLLQPNSNFSVWFNSTPTFAGTITSDASGQLNGQVQIPTTVTPGYHTVHIYGQDIGGQNVDLYKVVYVAATEDDYNGDGIPNAEDPCITLPASGTDTDKDGIDDACDPEISKAPADTVAPAVTGAASRAPDQSGWYNHSVNINWIAIDSEPSSGAPTQPAQTVADREGTQTYVSAASCDPAGNCAPGSITLAIDKTPPTISSMTWTGNPKSATGAATLTVHAADNLSGVVNAEYYIGGTDPGVGKSIPMQRSGSNFQIVFDSGLAAGSYAVHIRVADAAGNWSTASMTTLTVSSPLKAVLKVLQAIVVLVVTILGRLF